jgi:hypothetical protein
MPDLPVTPAMLRHFSVVTIAATACLAMFASGENSAARQGDSAIAAGTEKAALAQAKTEKPREIGGLRIAKGTDLRSADDEDYRDRIEEPVVGDIRYVDPSFGAPRTPETPALAAGPTAGMDPQVVRDPTGVPLLGAVQRRPGQRVAPPPRAPTQAEYDRMVAATRLRSGTPTVEDTEATD